MWCKSSGIQKEGGTWWWPQASKLEGGIKEKNSIERQLWKGGGHLNQRFGTPRHQKPQQVTVQTLNQRQASSG